MTPARVLQRGHAAPRPRRRAGIRLGAANPGQGRLGDELPPQAGSPRERALRDSKEANPARREEHRPPGGERLALGDLVVGAWEGLLAAGTAACPVCRGRMELEDVAARCRNCGARLS